MSSSSVRPQLGEVLLGRYTVDRLVGKGTFARVYHALCATGAEVAIKVARHTERSALLRFAREIEVLRALPPNPAVVAYLDHGTLDDGRPLLVMEYVDGITLEEGIRRCRQLTARQAAVLLAELCRAFTGLHALGVAHRDVKPGNILMTRQGEIKLVDFGLIRDAQGLLRLLEDEEVDSAERRVFAEELDFGLMAGTIEYMSPEQLLDSTVSDMAEAWTGTASDVYSLGVILLELLTGQRPFGKRPARQLLTGEEIHEFVRWRLRRTADVLSSIEGADPALLSILRKALCDDPRLRQPDCRALMDELHTYLETGKGVEIDGSKTIAVPLEAFVASVPTRIERCRPRRQPTDETARLARPQPPGPDDDTTTARSGDTSIRRTGRRPVDHLDDDQTSRWNPTLKKKPGR